MSKFSRRIKINKLWKRPISKSNRQHPASNTRNKHISNRQFNESINKKHKQKNQTQLPSNRNKFRKWRFIYPAQKQKKSRAKHPAAKPAKNRPKIPQNDEQAAHLHNLTTYGIKNISKWRTKHNK